GLSEALYHAHAIDRCVEDGGVLQYVLRRVVTGLVTNRRVVGVTALVGIELLGVEVAADGAPEQQRVGRRDRHTVGPGGVIVDGVLDLQRIVVDLLLGDVAGVVHEVQVVVVINDLVTHHVVDNGD